MGRVGDGARMSKTNMGPAIAFVGLGQLLPTTVAHAWPSCSAAVG